MDISEPIRAPQQPGCNFMYRIAPIDRTHMVVVEPPQRPKQDSPQKSRHVPEPGAKKPRAVLPDGLKKGRKRRR